MVARGSLAPKRMANRARGEVSRRAPVVVVLAAVHETGIGTLAPSAQVRTDRQISE